MCKTGPGIIIIMMIMIMIMIRQFISSVGCLYSSLLSAACHYTITHYLEFSRGGDICLPMHVGVLKCERILLQGENYDFSNRG